MPGTVNLDELSAWFLEAAPTLHADERIVAETLHELLLEGEPVAPERLAEASGRDGCLVESFLGRWAMRDEQGRIFAFLGLTLRETRHRLTVEGRDLHAWCAWDTLFLPGLLGRTVEIASRCPETGDSIHLRVSPSKILESEPSGIVVSFITPSDLSCNPEGCGETATVVAERSISRFCDFVHFLASRSAGQTWIANNPGTFLLTLEEAFDLGRRTNEGLLAPRTAI
ncbi:MAG: organomercurial lyase [Gemmatimonadota bacterium]